MVRTFFLDSEVRVPANAAPFVAEGFLETNVVEVVPALNIVTWTVPKNAVALLESYSLLPSSPVAYYDCLFDVAVDGRRINNIQFTQIQDGQERPPSFVRFFTEGQVVSLRLYRRVTTGGDISGSISLTFIGRLTGKFWGGKEGR
ncbi:MAG: hypothetical protein L0Z48_10715 [candidate division Zixibacteria bacterium]|nr:hypothetical protein [candidate division Zixibacteria bacterium]